MSSCDQASRKSDVHKERTVNLECYVMVPYHTTLNKDCVLRGEAAMAVDLSTFRTVFGKNNGELLDDPVFVCCLEKSLLD